MIDVLAEERGRKDAGYCADRLQMNEDTYRQVLCCLDYAQVA